MATNRGESLERHPDRLDVEIEEIVRCLRGYGVLTGERLAELVNADSWPEHTFKSALKCAIEHDRVARLDGDLYELTEQERAGP